MICKNATQLLRTALRNAIPMHSQGYTAKPSPFMPKARVFWVTKPEVDENGDPIVYDVSLSPETCTCQFFVENHTAFQLGECTCKHIEFCKAVEGENARIDRLVEEAEMNELLYADAANLLTEARADRAYFDKHNAPCHLPSPDLDASAADWLVSEIFASR